MKVAIYNDCNDPDGRHFGCQLTMQTYREQLDRVGAELLGTVSFRPTKRDDHRVLEGADLVLVNGEGSFHHNRRNDIANISKKFPCVLMNSIFQENDVDLSAFRAVSVRESMSLAEVLPFYPEAVVTPDIIFSNSTLLNFKKSPGRGTAEIRHYTGDKRLRTFQPADKFLAALDEYESVDTESFHGIIVAHMLRMPVMVRDAPGTFKNAGLFRDMRFEEAQYCRGAVGRVNSWFDSLNEYV